MSRRHSFAAALVAATLAACVDPNAARVPNSRLSLRARAASIAPNDPSTRREYGSAVRLGAGLARTYVAFDTRTPNVPLEVGVALSEMSMGELPPPMVMSQPMPSNGHEHVDTHIYDLSMPALNGTPYRFVELDWNPGGHEPAGVYDVPHFDFHFYKVEKSVRDGIDPTQMSKATYLEKSGKLPAEAERAPNYLALSAPGTPVMAVPRMGAHWIDVRTPELQGLFGRPEAYLPFTTTFLHGSWDGQFIFDEPMITRAFIMERKSAAAASERDRVIQLPQAKQFSPSGYYPNAYRISWDAEEKEYRIALTQLVRR
jgi:hypothetical protein